MPQYKVRHQCDKTCNDCEYYSCDIFEDSFGTYIDEYCDRAQYGHVGQYSEPCKFFAQSRGND